jgi:hypothetical protein
LSPLDDRYLSALRTAPSRPGSTFSGKQPKALVAAAERTLGVTFPPTYRRFLLELGAGGVGSEEIYGVFQADFVNSSVPDAVWATMDARREMDLPQAFVMIHYDGGEFFHILDTAEVDERGECPVKMWNPLLESAPPRVADNFASFFLDLLASAS